MEYLAYDPSYFSQENMLIPKRQVFETSFTFLTFCFDFISKIQDFHLSSLSLALCIHSLHRREESSQDSRKLFHSIMA